jgi:hypothetical protein
MSTVLSFTGKYLPQNENIYNCFSLERKVTLSLTVLERPWANGLNRLIAERRGLKKGQLAKIGEFRPALISAVLSPAAKYPDIESLIKIAKGLTAFDRKHNPHAPAVELWEFFVTDEQAAALRDRAIKTRTQNDDEALLARAAQILADSLAKAREERDRPVSPPTIVKAPAKSSSKR